MYIFSIYRTVFIIIWKNIPVVFMYIHKPFHYSEFKNITRQIAVYIDLSAYSDSEKGEKDGHIGM